jgi:NhaP-type Na+/H+ or K+/H+ antiporter
MKSGLIKLILIDAVGALATSFGLLLILQPEMLILPIPAQSLGALLVGLGLPTMGWAVWQIIRRAHTTRRGPDSN